MQTPEPLCPLRHHQPRVANERWKPNWSELRRAVSVKYTLDFKDLVEKKKEYKIFSSSYSVLSIVLHLC